uniref:Immunoglobulin V-set domain-containing protein n=1 Tax=Denticeps clupeoides TaxID=299321 RepID=A0AAY4BKM3_9TELE
MTQTVPGTLGQVFQIVINCFAGQSVVKLEGDSVTLDLGDNTGITRITWTFNMNKDIVTYYRSDGQMRIEDNYYKDKVLFNKANFSLLVKNLQKNDSGIYRITSSCKNLISPVCVCVSEPVKAPVLTLVSKVSTSDSCNVTVNCTGGDQYLVSSCDNTTCSQDKNTPALTISIRDYIIFCNSSNPVSWKNRTMDIKPVCHKMEDENKWTATIAICVSLIIVLILVIMYFIVKKRKSGKTNTNKFFFRFVHLSI